MDTEAKEVIEAMTATYEEMVQKAASHLIPILQQQAANKTAGDLLIAATNQIGAAMIADYDGKEFARDLAEAVLLFDSERLRLVRSAAPADTDEEE